MSQDREVTTVPEPDVDERLSRQVERLLYREADLLDDWRLHDWLALLTADARYLVPPTGDADPMSAEPETTLFLIADSRLRVEQRVVRLLKDTAYAEYPHSRTRHFVSNVQIVHKDGDALHVTSNFIVHRSKDSVTVSFVGKQRHILVPEDGSWKIREKRCCLDSDSLSPQGKLAIIL